MEDARTGALLISRSFSFEKSYNSDTNIVSYCPNFLHWQPFGVPERPIITMHSGDIGALVCGRTGTHVSSDFLVLPIYQRKRVKFLLHLSLVYRESSRKLRPTFRTICGCHTSSVNPDDRFNEGKSKPVSPRFASLDSSLEEVTSNFRIKTRAIIFHSKRGHAVVSAKRNTNEA